MAFYVTHKFPRIRHSTDRQASDRGIRNTRRRPHRIYCRNRYRPYYIMGKIYCTYTPLKPSQVEYLSGNDLMMVIMILHCYSVNEF